MSRFGDHQYITVDAKKGIIYVEGTYKEEFKNRIKFQCNGVYDPQNTRWKVPLQFKDKVIALAKQTFEKVMYSEGGDYETL